MQQQCLTKEHVEAFKQQMNDVIRCAKENPESVNHLGVNIDDDESGLIAGGLSDVVDGDGAKHTSVSVDVTRVGGTQPIPITLSVAVAAANDTAASHHHDNQSLTVAGGTQSSAAADARRPGGSFSAEMSSDAEYYTPVGSPDESHQSPITLVHIDELNAASALTAAVVGKVSGVSLCQNIHVFTVQRM